MQVPETYAIENLKKPLERFWDISAEKIDLIRSEYDTTKGSPVFTSNGKYTTRGWTEWTQGFQFGSELLQFDATGDTRYLNLGRDATVQMMAGHVTHQGVHDHGFNNVSTYGALRRLMLEGKIKENAWERHFYEMALKCSGAVQASRWTNVQGGSGFIYSFNGPHSLFVDTVRTLRILAIAHMLGHTLDDEQDEKICLLTRLIQHAQTTAAFNIYYDEGRDAFDVEGRTAHEAIFNTTNGHFRCPNSQQGYSPFSTWTRGLAWAMCGFAEQLEFLENRYRNDEVMNSFGGWQAVEATMMKAARATCRFYIKHTSLDGIPYWDTGAPDLHKLGDYTTKNADPYNDFEPVDSSAAAIAAQGLLRFGRYLQSKNENVEGEYYRNAGFRVAETLLKEPYLGTDRHHQGLLLHSVYHRPNGWDYIPEGQTVPCGESSLWGDYHIRELALYVWRELQNEPYYTFFDQNPTGS